HYRDLPGPIDLSVLGTDMRIGPTFGTSLFNEYFGLRTYTKGHVDSFEVRLIAPPSREGPIAEVFAPMVKLAAIRAERALDQQGLPLATFYYERGNQNEWESLVKRLVQIL